MMAKVTMFGTLLDDIFDSYGTLEELGPFDHAIQRWDLGALHELPDYMKVFIGALFDTFNDLEKEIRGEGNVYRVEYLREAMKVQSKVHYQELLWGHNKYVPKFHEHLQISAVSTTYPLIYVTSLVGMGDIATKEVFDWVIKVPQIIWSASLVCRLFDDIYPNEIEQENDQVPTSVQCYAIEHGLSKEEARLNISEVLLEDEWKRMNEELIKPDQGIPLAVYMPAFNMACVMAEAYKQGDGFNNPESDMKDNVSMILVDRVTI
ncbi:putative terpene synthase 2 [Acorus calamus]|uniref:Terpene synthase 2 n=1 Tax=Acorus calamus TaxID=4465 RepID=A0AAV9EIN2_ACOCL|nr:putative terpene synthase 2 [Acorus calamus]